MKNLINDYLNQEIGINIHDAFHIESVILKHIDDEYFSVLREKDQNTYHIPYFNIVRIVQNLEDNKGVTIGGLFQQKKNHQLVIKIGHIARYIA